MGSVAVGIVSKAVTLTAGSKDIYVVVADADGNVSAPLMIIALDLIAPKLPAGSVNRTSDTAATIGFTTDEAGTANYVVVSSGSAVPTSVSVRSGNSLGSVASGAVSGKAVVLTAGAKDIHVVVTDADGNISAPLKIAAPDNVPPVLSAGNMNRMSDVETTIGFTTTKAGTAYYIVVNSGSAVPTNASVKAGTSLFTVLAGAATNKAIVTTAGAKDVYVVVVDAPGNVSAPLRIVVPAYAPPVLSAGTSSRTSDTAATIGFTATKAGTAFCYITGSGEIGATNRYVRNSGISLGSSVAGANSKPVVLTAGAKDIYVVVLDAAGNVSPTLKFTIPAYVILALNKEDMVVGSRTAELNVTNLKAADLKATDLKKVV
jgi:hypothetical protein